MLDRPSPIHRFLYFFQAEDGIRDHCVTGVQTCALPILHTLSRVRPLPQKERELYDNARHLLVGEIAAATNIPLHVAEDNLDYALWPPEGMKRKGQLLPPATLGPPAPLARAADDDIG